MSVEHLQSDADRGKPKYADINLSISYSVHHKSHMDWNVSLGGYRAATDRLSQGSDTK